MLSLFQLVNNSNGCPQIGYGDTCTVICDPGFVASYKGTELVEFDLSCTMSGNWTNSSLTCSPLTCDALIPPANGTSNCSYTDSVGLRYSYSYLTVSHSID